MTDNPLVGTWTLVSYEVRDGRGEIIHPFGHDPAGYLTYPDDGFMCVAFMSAGRRPLAAATLRAASAEEKARVAESFISYCGTYELRGATVVHHVEVSLFPNWKGTELERTVDLAGDRLTLSTLPVPADERERTARLVWVRAAGRTAINSAQSPSRPPTPAE
jgi:hypothetical protein